MNKRRLRVLIVEDSEDDALLVSRELRHAGYDLAFERVETAESMNAALRREPWDVIIADYTLPKFSGMAALELLKSTGRDIPFIIVSGSIGEDLAVAAMRAGAHDYLMKGNIKRLVPSIERELRDAEGRRERRLAEAALRESEARKAAIFDSALDPIVLIDHAGKIIEFNSWAEKVFQHRRDQVIGRSLSDLVMLAGFDEGGQEAVSQRLAQIVSKRIEVAGRKRDGMTFPIELSLTAVLTDIEPVFTAHIRDLSEQKKQEAIRERSRQLEEQNRRIEEASRLKNQFFAQ
ncbi:MAG TPA: PAS domain S-box protein, partial [Candidatus Binatia bacterium]|nr:PAS domain S-box protein [Candidatus Binatia bacterium]